jgi:peptidoglycan hydrolase-like protein with peptidoglycan-binding domain
MPIQSKSGALRGTRGKHAALASWVFGSILIAFLFAFCFIIPEPTPSQAAILHFFMAVLSGLFAYFFVGDAVLKGNIKGQKFAAGGGFALFIAMQFFVDPSALRSLAGEYFPKLVRPDSRLENAQTTLNRLHILAQEPNGIRDSATTKALRQFQTAYKLRPDGLLTKDTLITLNSANKDITENAASAGIPNAGGSVDIPPTFAKTNTPPKEDSPEVPSKTQDDLKSPQTVLTKIGTKSFTELLATTQNKAGANYVLSIFSEELKVINADNFAFDIYDMKSRGTVVVPAGFPVVPQDGRVEVQSDGLRMQVFVSDRGNTPAANIMALEQPPSIIGAESKINWVIDPRWSLPALRSVDYPNGNSWGRVAWSGTTPIARYFAVTIITLSDKTELKICVINERPNSNSGAWIQMDLAAHFSELNLQ